MPTGHSTRICDIRDGLEKIHIVCKSGPKRKQQETHRDQDFGKVKIHCFQKALFYRVDDFLKNPDCGD